MCRQLGWTSRQLMPCLLTTTTAASSFTVETSKCMLSLLSLLLCCVMVPLYVGTLVGRLAAVAEQVEGLQSSMQHKAEGAGLQEVRQQVREVRQQGQGTSQSLADLHSSVHQQGQDQATGLHRLEALLATASQGKTAAAAEHAWMSWLRSNVCLHIAEVRCCLRSVRLH